MQRSESRSCTSKNILAQPGTPTASVLLMWGRVPKETLSLWSYRDGGMMTATISATRTLLNVAMK